MERPTLGARGGALALEIRPFRARDSIVELTELLHWAFASLGERGLNYTAVDQTPEVTANRISRGTCFVAVIGDVLVGTVIARASDPTSRCCWFARPEVASAGQLGVSPAYQRQRIGSMLMQTAEDWARAAGFREIAVDTAEPALELIEFYRRRSYRHVGVVQWSGKVYRSAVMSRFL